VHGGYPHQSFIVANFGSHWREPFARVLAAADLQYDSIDGGYIAR
jgi:hypothetical protein